MQFEIKAGGANLRLTAEEAHKLRDDLSALLVEPVAETGADKLDAIGDGLKKAATELRGDARMHGVCLTWSNGIKSGSVIGKLPTALVASLIEQIQQVKA